MPQSESRILEGIVTTVSDAAAFGSSASLSASAFSLINVAPMGPMVDAAMHRLILRPFTSSTTYRNLKATGEGVFHVTDDVLMIARGAIGMLPATIDEASGPGIATIRPADVVRGVVLTGACRYYEFQVISLDDSQERTRIEAEVVHTGTLRDFFGFNRAMHAVIEAAILATRVHLTGTVPVLAELDRLTPAIDKTGGPLERLAMQELRAFLQRVEDAMQPPTIV